MRKLIILGFIILGHVVNAQIMSGLAESKNLFFIEAEPSVFGIDIDNFFIDQSVWYCEFYIVKKTDTLRHTIAINPIADTLQTRVLTNNINSLIEQKGEIIIKGINKIPEYEGMLKFDHIVNIEDVKSYSYYSKHSNNYPKSFLAFSTKYKGDLDVDDYNCSFIVKTKQNDISGSFKIPKTKPEKFDSSSNWFDHSTGTGYYNGHKLYEGSRGGIYYISNGNKIYVTSEFR